MKQTFRDIFLKDALAPTPTESSMEATIRGLQNQLDEQADVAHDNSIVVKDYDSSPGASGSDGFNVVGEQIDLATLQQLYASEAWVFNTIWVIAKTIGTLPLKLEKRKLSKQTIVDAHGKNEEIFKESWIDANAEPEFQILAHPNNVQLPVEFWCLMVIDLLATGNAYILVDKGEDAVDLDRPLSRLETVMRSTRKTNVQGMYRLNSALIEPIFDDDKIGLAGYGMQTQEGFYTFQPDEIIHIRLPNPLDTFVGLAPLVPVLKNVLIDRFSSEHMIRFYKQGARLGGVVKTNKKLTKDQITRLTRSFEGNYTGKKNHHKTLILPEGMEYQIIEQNPGETSLIEFAKFNKEPILSAYGVPPVKVGLLDGATYANALVQDKTFWTNSILPFKAFIESAINHSDTILKTARNLKFSFDTSHVEVLQETLLEKADVAKKMSESGWSINEIRQEIWKKPTVVGGDMIPLIERTSRIERANAQELAARRGNSKADPDGRQPDLDGMTDIEPTMVTYEQRVGELTQINIQAGIPVAQSVERAIEQAVLEGFKPTGIPLESTRNPPESTENDENESESDGKDLEKDIKRQNYCKLLTGPGVQSIMERKYIEVKAMFDRMLGKLNEDLEQIDFADPNIEEIFSKSATKEGDDDLPIFKWLTQFAKDEVKRLGETDLSALNHGFGQTLTSESATFPNDKAQKFLEERGGEQITNITEYTREQIKGVISRAYKEQAPSDEISTRIQEHFGFIKEGRAKTITRTETLTAVSQGQKMKINELEEIQPGFKGTLKKRWITAQDERVRDGKGGDADHVGLDGEVVNENETFSNGLELPRDTRGSAKEVINCRCTAIYFVEDDESEIDSILPESFDFAGVIDTLF